MRRLILCLSVICTACGVAEQPKWAETIAAYEVPLPTDTDKARFIRLLREEGASQGFHVDAATRDELAIQSEVFPMTFNASVWRGEEDEELMASAMDFRDRIGRVWISFPLGQESARSARFREKLVPKIKEVLSSMGLRLGMEIPGWPPENIEEMAKKLEQEIMG